MKTELNREVITDSDRFKDVELDLNYASTISGKWMYHITWLMLLMFAWLFAVHSVELVEVACFLILAGWHDAWNEVSVVSSWGGGAFAWAALVLRELFALAVVALTSSSGISLWRQWRIAGRMRKGELVVERMRRGEL